MYGKLIDGAVTYAPKKLTIGEFNVWNASSAQYAEQGWLPVVYTEPGEPPEGYEYEPHWEEQSGEIVEVWELVEAPFSDEEALGIILGEVE